MTSDTNARLMASGSWVLTEGIARWVGVEVGTCRWRPSQEHRCAGGDNLLANRGKSGPLPRAELVGRRSELQALEAIAKKIRRYTGHLLRTEPRYHRWCSSYSEWVAATGPMLGQAGVACARVSV